MMSHFKANMILQCWAGFPHLVSEQVGVVGELGANGTIQEAWQTRHVDHFTWQFRAPGPVFQQAGWKLPQKSHSIKSESQAPPDSRGGDLEYIP